MRLLLAGDVMLGRGIDQVLPHPSSPELFEPYVRDARDYVAMAEQVNGPVGRLAHPWGDALAALDRADVRVLNLETAVTTSDDHEAKGINYRMHPANVGALAVARPDVVVLANNHVLDWGERGLAETLDTLRAAGLLTCGAGRDLAEARAPAVVRGVRVVAAATGDAGVPSSWAADGGPGVHRVSLHDRDADALAEAVAGEGVRVVSLHWGTNWGYDVPEAQVRFAHRLIDAGVDVVHGHSSHHPRPFEVYRGRLVLYGCGDLLNDYEGIRGHEAFRGDLSLLYTAVLGDDGALSRLELTPLRIARLRLNTPSEADARWLAESVCRGRDCGYVTFT